MQKKDVLKTLTIMISLCGTKIIAVTNKLYNPKKTYPVPTVDTNI